MREISRCSRALLLLLAGFCGAAVLWLTALPEGETPVTAEAECALEEVPPTPRKRPDGSPFSLLEGERLDVNRADALELSRLPGIGLSRGEAIVAYRSRYGAFRNLKQLRKVPGISETVWNGLQGYVTLGPGT